MPQEHRYCTRKLGHLLSNEVRGSVIVPCHTCRDQYYSTDIGAKRERCWPARLRNLDYRASREARGDVTAEFIIR